jgi:hypothetical protein
LFVATFSNPVESALFRQTVGAGFVRELSAGAIVTDQLWTFGAAWGDADGDGDLDVLVATLSGYSSTFYENLADGTFLGHALNDEVTSVRHTALGDLNGDGFLDAVICDTTCYLYYNQHQAAAVGSYRAATDMTFGGRSRFAAFADFDSDGHVDLARQSGQRCGLEVLRNSGDGHFLPPVNVHPTSAPCSTAVAWGDADQDTDLDLFVATTGANYLLKNNQGSFTLDGGFPADIADSRDAAWGVCPLLSRVFPALLRSLHSCVFSELLRSPALSRVLCILVCSPRSLRVSARALALVSCMVLSQVVSCLPRRLR